MTPKWFSAVESTHVVGRFVDVEVVDVKASEIAHKNVYKKIPALESKVTGSHDTSMQAVKPFNEDELRGRFPGAWEFYLEHRVVEEAPAVPVIKAKQGTPLSSAEFLPRDKIGWLEDMGFSTLEQIRDMSDTTVQNLGRGALSWRKKAQEQLART